MKRPTLWFVSPAHGRYELTKICLEQRAWMCEQLGDHGIEANCVVIAEDANLDFARKFGFFTIDCPNDYLGRKFNEGYAWAGERGIDYVAPIGSDTWADPAGLYDLPTANEILCSHWYAQIRSDGRERSECYIDPHNERGESTCSTVGLVIPTKLMEPCNFRPCWETISSGCDGSTLAAIQAENPVAWKFADLHPLQNIAWRSDTGITSYEKLHRRYGRDSNLHPFRGLADTYPLHLVEKMRKFYVPVEVAA